MGRLLGFETIVGEYSENSAGEEKLWVNEGNLYGEAGEGFVRINIACPRQRLIEGLNRMRRALSSPITSFT